MDHSELVDSFVSMFGPLPDEELARELAAIRLEAWTVRQDEPSSPAVLVFEQR